MRKTVLKFDDVMNAQRKIIYEERDKVLEGLPLREQILNMYPEVISNVVRKHLDEDKPYFEWDLSKINADLEKGLIEKGSDLVDENFVEDCDVRDVEDKILNKVKERYNKQVEYAKAQGVDFANVERFVMLKVVDANWMNHIDDMQIMKNEIFARGFGNQDPVLAYKKDGYELFEKMVQQIRETVSLILLSIKIQVEKPPEKVQRPTFTPIARKENLIQDKPKTEKPKIQTTVINDGAKIGRNDSCPCGSGKKYKNCCGK